ncbi:hypothetical protein [Streptomyces poriticola]|uniref:hypothetical protein n=1 Tax=Streptomyces poriticola TaxID=3120506 RepID=UPI002FCE4020
MARTCIRGRRRVVALLAACLLTAGCSTAPQGGAQEDGRAGGRSSAGGAPPSASPSPAATALASSGPSTFEPDPDKVPRTRAEALSLARAVAFLPRDWGDGFVAQDPAESAPDTWAVLDSTCSWTREPLPGGVLAAVSRYSELPVGEGGDTLRVTAVVTVHATQESADDRLNTTLEEVMRCPQQEIRTGERITDLNSVGRPAGGDQRYADDSVFEMGTYVRQRGETVLEYPYQWLMDRYGTVTVAVSVRGAQGADAPDPTTVSTRGTVGMRTRVIDRLEGES